MSYLLLVGCFLLSNLVAAVEQDRSIPVVNNLQNDGLQQLRNSQVILLYVSAPLCPYCKKLEEEILLPLIKSGDYQNKIILRKIDWRSMDTLIGFLGEKTSPEKLLRGYHIRITPTLLFLDHTGKEIHQRLLGYQGGEFYWYYFDAAIKQSNQMLIKAK